MVCRRQNTKEEKLLHDVRTVSYTFYTCRISIGHFPSCLHGYTNKLIRIPAGSNNLQLMPRLIYFDVVIVIGFEISQGKGQLNNP